MFAKPFTWGNFHDISPISLIKSYGLYFSAGENFAKKVISRKTRTLPPRENFHVYSTPFIPSLLSKWRKQLVYYFFQTGTSISMVFCLYPTRVWELPDPDVSCLTWDQRHDREQHFCFSPWLTSVDREGRPTSHFHLKQTGRFQFLYCKRF